MVWEWSHSDEGLANARNNLDELDEDTLRVIFAEWRAAQGKRGIINSFHPGFDQKKYDRALAFAKQWMNPDTLADFIWEKAQEYATCDNGGWNAWMCPYGCGCHMVPFSSKEEMADTA